MKSELIRMHKISDFEKGLCELLASQTKYDAGFLMERIDEIREDNKDQEDFDCVDYGYFIRVTLEEDW